MNLVLLLVFKKHSLTDIFRYIVKNLHQFAISAKQGAEIGYF